MAMTLDLLDRTFTDTETLHTIVEAKEKGVFFFKCVKSIKANLQDDYWIQVAREWDLNFHKRFNHWYMDIYRVVNSETQSQAPVSSILLDTWELL